VIALKYYELKCTANCVVWHSSEFSVPSTQCSWGQISLSHSTLGYNWKTFNS